MKPNWWLSLLTPTAFMLLIGCSSTYKVEENFSQEELYKDFNNSAQNKKVEVILSNDSSLAVPEGAEVKDYSMLLNYSPNYYPKKIKKERLIPLNEIKQASFTNHWKGLAPGIYVGMTAGGLIGATGLVFKIEEDGNNRDHRLNSGYNFFLGAISGIAIGAIVGAIIGWENIYQFNP